MRDAISFFAAYERETLILCLKFLASCVVLSPIFVSMQDGNKGGIHRRRTDLGFAKFDREWRQLIGSLRDKNFRSAPRHLQKMLVNWFNWKKLTPMGALDTKLVTFFAVVTVLLLLVEVVLAFHRIFAN